MEKVLTIDPVMSNASGKNIGNIIGQFGKRLLSFIRQRVKSEADAEDILQDVWYQFSASAEPIEQVGSWLFKVARNRITDSYRKKKPELPGNLESEGEDFGIEEFLAETDNNPETEFLRGLFWETLERALKELPEEQRQVFVQHELENISFKSISESTGIPVNTLISRKRYAVLHLRDRLNELRTELLNY